MATPVFVIDVWQVIVNMLYAPEWQRTALVCRETCATLPSLVQRMRVDSWANEKSIPFARFLQCNPGLKLLRSLEIRAWRASDVRTIRALIAQLPALRKLECNWGLLLILPSSTKRDVGPRALPTIRKLTLWHDMAIPPSYKFVGLPALERLECSADCLSAYKTDLFDVPYLRLRAYDNKQMTMVAHETTKRKRVQRLSLAMAQDARGVTALCRNVVALEHIKMLQVKLHAKSLRHYLGPLDDNPVVLSALLAERDAIRRVKRLIVTSAELKMLETTPRLQITKRKTCWIPDAMIVDYKVV